MIPATRRREALLQLPAPKETLATQDSAPENVSKSEQIAQAVLRGDSISLGSTALLGNDGTRGQSSAENLQLAAGSGVAGNPIVVTLKERELIAWRWIIVPLLNATICWTAKGAAAYRFARFALGMIAATFRRS